MRNKILNKIQLLTGIHKIHHVRYSYGWKLPFFEVGYFTGYAKTFKSNPFKKLNEGILFDIDLEPIEKHYHNCSLTGIN